MPDPLSARQPDINLTQPHPRALIDRPLAERPPPARFVTTCASHAQDANAYLANPEHHPHRKIPPSNRTRQYTAATYPLHCRTGPYLIKAATLRDAAALPATGLCLCEARPARACPPSGATTNLVADIVAWPEETTRP